MRSSPLAPLVVLVAALPCPVPLRAQQLAPPANVDVTHTEVAVNVGSRLVVDLPSGNTSWLRLHYYSLQRQPKRRPPRHRFRRSSHQHVDLQQHPAPLGGVQLLESPGFGPTECLGHEHRLRTHRFHKREHASNAVCPQKRFLTNSVLKEIWPAVESLKP